MKLRRPPVTETRDLSPDIDIHAELIPHPEERRKSLESDLRRVSKDEAEALPRRPHGSRRAQATMFVWRLCASALLTTMRKIG